MVRAQSLQGSGEETEHAFEYRILLADGTVKHVRTLRRPVFNASGEVVEVVGTTMDITERKLAEQEREKLRKLEAELVHMNRVSTMGEMAASLAMKAPQVSRMARGSRNASTPYWPYSRPTPEYLKPPQGACGSSVMPLITTRPARNWEATRRAR